MFGSRNFYIMKTGVHWLVVILMVMYYVVVGGGRGGHLDKLSETS